MPQANFESYYKRTTDFPEKNGPFGLPIPNSERPNRSAVYRHHRFRDGPLLTTMDPNIRTIHDMLEFVFQEKPKHKCFGVRKWIPETKTWEPKYSWVTFGEVAERRKNLGTGIVEILQKIGYTGDKYGVGLWSQNRPEWHLIDMAATSQALFTVSLYDTLGPDTTEYIINHAELPIIACSVDHIPTLLQLAPRIPTLKAIISLDALEHGEEAGRSKRELLNQMAAPVGLKIYGLEEVEQIGIQSGRPMRSPQPEDFSTINYTSGTTGPPKGVVLTHNMAVSAVNTAMATAGINNGDTHISYLPLAHIYGRLVDQLTIVCGGATGFFHGDPLGLIEDLKILKPTTFVSVPRLYNRINSAIKTATVDAPGVKGSLMRHVINTKKSYMSLPLGQAHNSHFLYDRTLIPKIRSAVGMDKVRSMTSGSAQLDPDVQEFLGAAFSNHFRQGYGMTETYAVATVQLPGDYRKNCLGPPLPNTEICLESVPDYNYSVEDKPYPRGEILLRGPGIFKGYYKNKEETDKTVEADGWFHTGDIGLIDETGCLKIIDRKKNVLKLAQGEYISPERIENAYLANTNLLAAAYVHGDSSQASLVAIFAVDPENFAPFAGKILGRTIAASDRDAVTAACAEPQVKAELQKVLAKIGRKLKFNSYENVRNFDLAVEPFTVDNGILTPTLKLKRPIAGKAFRTNIDRLYAELAKATPAATMKL